MDFSPLDEDPIDMNLGESTCSKRVDAPHESLNARILRYIDLLCSSLTVRAYCLLIMACLSLILKYESPLEISLFVPVAGEIHQQIRARR
jgi:hypothetical protein